mgnify:CR=1 FL=1
MMTVKECYESMEADFEGVIGRMAVSYTHLTLPTNSRV